MINEVQPDVLHEEELLLTKKNRKTLLPWWVKLFSWLFLVSLIIVPVGLIAAVLGYKFALSIYEIETNDPLSITGLFLLSVFLLKGVTALSLLMKKDIAVTFAIIDATLGILICLGAMIYHYNYPQTNINGSFRVELLLLIPYLIKMIRIYTPWKNAV